MSRIATPVRSSADDLQGETPATVAPAESAVALRWPGRALMLALNLLPLLHTLAPIALVAALPSTWSWVVRGGAGVAFLWLAPPLACRVLLAIIPLRDGRHPLGGRTFFAWWTTLQLQTLFLRLPFLEETLRLVPGAYSLWLRLWGSRIGRFTYWAPGLEITDRSLLEIGDDVVTGAKSRLGAHLLTREAGENFSLLIGRIRLGDRVMMGLQSAIGAGTRLDAGEVTHAFFLAPPFSHWRGGKRIRSESPEPANPPSPDLRS